MRVMLSFIVSILIVGSAYSIDIAPTSMKGNTIMPLSNVNVRLSEIHTVMKRELGKATQVTSKFILENLSDEKLRFKVAFPIEPSDAELPKDFRVTIDSKPIKTSITKLLEKTYRLRIRGKLPPEEAKADENMEKQRLEIIKTFEVKPSKYMSLISWHVALNPKEIKTITCEYSLDWDGSNPPSESFLFYLTPGALWRKNIEKVYVQISLSNDLLDYIRETNSSLRVWPKSHYQIKGNIIEWSFERYRPTSYKDTENIGLSIIYAGPGE